MCGEIKLCVFHFMQVSLTRIKYSWDLGVSVMKFLCLGVECRVNNNHCSVKPEPLISIKRLLAEHHMTLLTKVQ